MSYTVLARKWRPKNFSELVGQTHVMQALSNALDSQRLHHAYLFTGTRGVGKTTIARIFAKALNCEQGISATPCGVCSVCQSINEGRFVDLIEIDAASRTKVEDTREILDNVQYAPTQGRYKVYLIDEVHMLSKSSFNALLKTLEEPPEHVKFLLATTDPHKLPITVLSRCLQFNLLRLTTVQIQQHLAHILGQEQIESEPAALALIAKSADGSARDALSLMDQAIAYCGGAVKFEAVQSMLGLVDQGIVQAILLALVDDSADQIKQILQTLSSLGVDYSALLNQLLETLHQITQSQILGEVLDEGGLPAEVLGDLAERLSADQVQLYYQIGLLARQDISLAPDIRIGFEMTLLRMLAFKPVEFNGTKSANSQPGLVEKQPENSGSPSVAALLKQAQSKLATPPMPARVSSPQPQPHLQAPSNHAPVNQPPANPLPENQQSINQPSISQPSPAATKPMADLSLFPELEARVAGAQTTKAESGLAPVPAPAQIHAPAQTLAPARVHAPIEDSTQTVNAPAAVPEKIAAPSAAWVSPPSQPADMTPPWQVEALPEQTQQQIAAMMPPEASVQSAEPAQSEQLTGQPQPIETWCQIIDKVKPEGMALELARRSILMAYNNQAWWLSVSPAHQMAKSEIAMTRLLEAAQAQWGAGFQIHYVDDYQGAFYTPDDFEKDQQHQHQQQAVEAIKQDPNTAHIETILNMQLLEKTIQPI
ncbi:DNA polymerase III subunit gamma/tau [Thiomicrospira microaerophila]|uniref:DNA polymerase III subunit gamma/tau n=1 Tax=Thiomicrospira microaerophila TaxID=406020 RepID=UPI0005C99C86|nr:DNA polymerase III subunit gamma/tau [Thiomicrospira microaerophila]